MNIGIVGAGMIVSDLLTFIHEVEGLKIEAFCGMPSDEERLKQFASENNVSKIYLDLNEMLKDEAIDTVYLGVPNHLHYPLAKSSLLANKHVIAEKPFTSNHREALDLADLSKKQGKIILEGVSTRFLPNFLKIKELLPTLGDIKIVTTNYSQYSSRYDKFKEGEIAPAFSPRMSGGALLDINIYNLNFVATLFGEPKDIQYLANVERGIDTSGILILDYGHFKCVCTGAKDCKAPLMNTIQGDKAAIVIESSLNVMADFKYFKNDGKRGPGASDFTLHDENNGKHRMYHEFVEFVRILKENDVARAQELLDLSVLTMKIQTIAREKAGVVFAADEVK